MSFGNLELLDVDWFISFQRDFVHERVGAPEVEFVLADCFVMT